MIHTTHNQSYEEVPDWFKRWEDTGLIAWVDKNNDGIINLAPGKVLTAKKPVFAETEDGEFARGEHGQRLVSNANSLNDNPNELYVDRDIMVLANPEIAQLPNWIVGLVVAGGIAAALSTAAGLLLVISSSISMTW